MNVEMLERAVALGERVGHALVATADRHGRPHLAVAKDFKLAPGGRVSVTAWFCPGTMANASENKHVSVVVWDAASDKGLQLTGQVESIRDLAVLDGYVPLKESRAIPQVDRELVIRVDKVLEFTHAPHSDVEA